MTLTPSQPSPQHQFSYQVGGSLPPESQTYVRRPADDNLLQALLDGEFCYVFNSRQMGKSSLRVQVMAQLRQAGVQCGGLDLTAIGTQQVNVEQWYAAIAAILSKQFQLKTNFRQWWREHLDLPPAARLSSFIEDVLLSETQAPLVILIDEIDSILALKFATDDFFALIRNIYNQRADCPACRRLSFALFGVTTPGELIADKTRTPFNIGRGIYLDGFQAQEAAPLAAGLMGIIPHPQQVLERILHWTGGQPFLMQKLCNLVVSHYDGQKLLDTDDPNCIENLIDLCVHKHILHHWEAQDEPEHLKTIRDRLLYDERKVGQLLTLYRQVWQAEQVQSQHPLIPANESPTQTELLLSGVVEKRDSYLRVKNPIYERVFDLAWIDYQLDHLRPYAPLLNAWVDSNYQDQSRLLRGQALREALDWTQRKSLGDLDYRYLTASQDLEQQEIQQNLKFERQEAQRKLEQERLVETQQLLKLQEQNVRRQRQFLGVLTVALIGAIGLGSVTFVAYQRAALSEVRAVLAASKGSYASNQRLDALVQALQGRHNFKQLRFISDDVRQELDQDSRQALEKAIQGNHEFNRLQAHAGGALGVDYSRDGQWLASSGTDGTAKLWRRDGTLVETFEYGVSIYSVQFSPDSQLLAIPTLDGQIHLWSVTGEWQRTLRGHDGPIWRLAWSPDGGQLVSASSDKTVRLWSRDGELLRTLTGHQAPVWDVDFHPQGEEFASISLDGQIKLWGTDGTLRRSLEDNSSSGWSVAYSPDGEELIGSYSDNRVRIWRRDGQLLRSLSEHESEVVAVAFSPDGSQFASGSADRQLKLWSRDGTPITSLQGHHSGLRGVAFSPEGTEVASAGDDGLVRLWQVENAFRQKLPRHRNVIWGVAYAPSSSPIASQLASLSRQDLYLWDERGRLIQEFSNLADQALYDVVFHPHRPQVFVSDAGGEIHQIDLTNNTITRQGQEDEFSLFALDISPDGRWLVSGGDNKQIQVWREDTSGAYVLHQILEGHQARVWDLAFSPDGSYLVSGSLDGTARIWGWESDLAEENRRFLEVPERVLRGDQSDVWGVAVSPDGDRIVSASRNGLLKVWTRQGEEVFTLTLSENNGLTRVAWSPDGQLLAVGRTDNHIDLYTEAGVFVSRLTGHEALVLSVAFSPEGRFLVSGSEDRLAIRWNLDSVLSVNLLEYGCRRVQDYLHTSAEINLTSSLCQDY
ncbi:MAG: WD40 repeat protein [Phormidium sp. OSCR]|nr:MAG: WD40 repeat protein [Phormidium sp. OSCR]